MKFLPMWMKGLTPEMVEKAEKELGETPKFRKEAVEELRRLIEDEEGFRPLMDESFLLRFLRVRKYDVNRAFKTLKNYYAHRTKFPDILNFTPSEVRSYLEMDKILIPPKRLPSGANIVIGYVGACDVDTYHFEKFIGVGFMCIEIGLEAEASQVCGGSLILDFKGTNWRKMRHLSSPSNLSLLIKGVQECWPYRLTSIHITNEPSYVSFLWSIVKPMMTKKMRDRVFFHGSDLDTLHSYFSPELLPEELGGQLGEKDFEECRNIILNSESISEKLNEFVFQGVNYPKNKIKLDPKEKKESFRKKLIKRLSFERFGEVKNGV